MHDDQAYVFLLCQETTLVEASIAVEGCVVDFERYFLSVRSRSWRNLRILFSGNTPPK